MTNRLTKIGWIYLVIMGIYAIYSYALVDPNLVLSSQPQLWQLQNLIWRLGYQERFWSSITFILLVTVMFGCYFLIIKESRDLTKSIGKSLLKIFIGLLIVLSLSYPALSHDIFNYLFNAKMVLVYHANPHINVALDFPQDPWLQFMNNTHTPAPYALGWTAMSLLPAALGFGHLKMTMVIFRLFMIVGLLVLLAGQKKLTPKGNMVWFWAFALNPLVLIETVSNIHNDIVMMALVIWALICAKKALTGNKGWWLLAVFLWLMSVSIKYASIMVLVGIIWWAASKRTNKPISFGGTQAIVNFLPLLTARSQRFLAWYLIWPLTFLPLIKEGLIRETLLLFSFTALLSYFPYIYVGEYSPALLILRQLIIFVPPITYALTKILVMKKVIEK